MTIPAIPHRVPPKAIAMVPIEDVRPGMISVDGVVLDVQHVIPPGQTEVTLIDVLHRSCRIIEKPGKPMVIFASLSDSVVDMIREGIEVPERMTAAEDVVRVREVAS